VEQEKGLSERRACRLLELDRSSYRYAAVADGDAELRGSCWSWRGRSHAMAIGDCMCYCSAKARR